MSWLLPRVPAARLLARAVKLSHPSVVWMEKSPNGFTWVPQWPLALCQGWTCYSSLHFCCRFSPSRAMTSTLLLLFVSSESTSSTSPVMTMQHLWHHGSLNSHIVHAKTWAGRWNSLCSLHVEKLLLEILDVTWNHPGTMNPTIMGWHDICVCDGFKSRISFQIEISKFYIFKDYL